MGFPFLSGGSPYRMTPPSPIATILLVCSALIGLAVRRGMFFTSLSSITVLNEELNGNAIYKCGYEVKRTGGQMASTSRRAEAKADKEDTKLTAKSGVLGKSIHSTDMELRR
ncbi:hypothetical protein RUM44_004229 [Polyplax serrata]|uniref:Uncharacterized protein n=1 Tax=Polyplax serrata TaxID=468196 RepID=A0ABR1B291_POLSC